MNHAKEDKQKNPQKRPIEKELPDDPNSPSKENPINPKSDEPDQGAKGKN